VLNLLPIPILDGGQSCSSSHEAVGEGRCRASWNPAEQCGILLLIALMILALTTIPPHPPVKDALES